MVRPCNRIIVLILAAVLLTACAPASTSTPLLTVGTPTVVSANSHLADCCATDAYRTACYAHKRTTNHGANRRAAD